MKIETEKVKEIDYDELTTQDIRVGDLLLIKKNSSNGWIVQFITMITSMGMYLHINNNKLDNGGIILWPEHTEKQKNLDIQKLYDNTKFIHISIKNGYR